MTAARQAVYKVFLRTKDRTRKLVRFSFGPPEEIRELYADDETAEYLVADYGFSHVDDDERLESRLVVYRVQFHHWQAAR